MYILKSNKNKIIVVILVYFLWGGVIVLRKTLLTVTPFETFCLFFRTLKNKTHTKVYVENKFFLIQSVQQIN